MYNNTDVKYNSGAKEEKLQEWDVQDKKCTYNVTPRCIRASFLQ
jgi:hypothetical protein